MSDPDAQLLRRLLDIEEVKRLKARYFRTLDQKDWDGFGRVFARDAVLEVPEAGLVERGRDAIVASVSGALTGTQTVHHGHMPEIELAGVDRARGTWAMSDYVEWPRSEAGERFGAGRGVRLGDIPEQDGGVLGAGGEELAVGGEGDGVDAIPVALKDGGAAARLEIPESRGAIG